jgi:hypothetical protein
LEYNTHPLLGLVGVLLVPSRNVFGFNNGVIGFFANRFELGQQFFISQLQNRPVEKMRDKHQNLFKKKAI